MSNQTLSDFEFLLLCHKVADVRPDFDVVGEEAGCLPRSAYHRHWRLMRNAPALGSSAWVPGFATPGTGDAGAVVSATAATPKKRGRKPKGEVKAEADIKQQESDDNDADTEPTPKKIKVRKTSNKSKSKEKATTATADDNGDDKKAQEVITIPEDDEQE